MGDGQRPGLELQRQGFSGWRAACSVQPPSPLLFLASGDLFSLRENLASSTASVLFPGSWPFPKKRNVGQHSR